MAAGARHERTLAAVACSALIMIEASPPAYPSGMLALGKKPRTHEEETSGDSTPTSTHVTVVSTCMPAPCMSAS
jgi:hypothetical protein